MFLSFAKDLGLGTHSHPAHQIPRLLSHDPKEYPRWSPTSPLHSPITTPETHIPIVRNRILQSVDLVSFPALSCARSINVRCAESPGPIHSLDYSPNGMLCTLEPLGEYQCEVKLQDITLNTPVPASFMTGVVHSMSLSPLEPAVLVGQAESSPVLVEANGDFEERVSVRTDAAVIYSSFDRASKTNLATSDILNDVHVWDMRRPARPTWSCVGSRVEAIHMTGHALFGACMNQIAMWDLRVGSEKGPLNSFKPQGFRPFGIAFEERWGTVISVGYLNPCSYNREGGIAIWNPAVQGKFLEVSDVTVRAWPIPSEGGVLVEGERQLFVLGGPPNKGIENVSNCHESWSLPVS